MNCQNANNCTDDCTNWKLINGKKKKEKQNCKNMCVHNYIMHIDTLYMHASNNACTIHNYQSNSRLCVYIHSIYSFFSDSCVNTITTSRFYPSDDGEIMWKIVNHCLADPWTNITLLMCIAWFYTSTPSRVKV